MLVTICLNKFMITIFIINKLKLYFILITLTRSHLFEFVNNLKKNLIIYVILGAYRNTLSNKKVKIGCIIL